MSDTLVGLLRSVGAKPVAKGEWEFDTCWRCGGSKCLYFNLDKMIGVCHRCLKPVSLRDIATELAGVSVKDLKEFVEDYAVQARRVVGFEEAMLDILIDPKARTLAQLSEVELPIGYRPLTDCKVSVMGRRALNYLTGRGFSEIVLFENKFGYCAHGPYEGRVIIPFYEQGTLVYWQARDFTGAVDPKDKIKNPPSGFTLHGKSDVLFNHDCASKCNSVIITESWGSTLAVGHMAVALNGKSMSDVQFIKLCRMKAGTFVVMLDPGTQAQAWSIAQRLSAAGRYALVATLKDGDPAEVPRSVLFDSVRHAKAYTGPDHMRQVMLASWF